MRLTTCTQYSNCGLTMHLYKLSIVPLTLIAIFHLILILLTIELHVPSFSVEKEGTCNSIVSNINIRWKMAIRVKGTILSLYKCIVRPQLEYCVQVVSRIPRKRT